MPVGEIRGENQSTSFVFDDTDHAVRLFSLSIGTEVKDDLIADLKQALDAV